ncbi:MAG TPA: hypothetical protein VGO34_14760 [Alphaproteobacteria bacterium]|jgi:DNA-binding Xre family transcriptional regulator
MAQLTHGRYPQLDKCAGHNSAARDDLAAASAVVTTRTLAGLATSAQDLADAIGIERAEGERMLIAVADVVRLRLDAICASIRQGVG